MIANLPASLLPALPQRDFPGQAALPLEALHEASRRLHAEAAMGAALPAIRSQFAALEADVGGFLSELDPNSGGGGSNRSVSGAGGGQGSKQEAAWGLGCECSS